MAKAKADEKNQPAAGAAAAGDSGAAAGGAGGLGADPGAGGSGGNMAPPAVQPDPVDPAVAAAARAAGLDPADLDEQDLAELRAAAAVDAGRQPAARPGGRILVREANGNSSNVAVSLLLEACERFGVNPAADVKPQELLAWRFYQGADEPGRVAPDAVVIVTAGGAKLKHWDDPSEPMDQDTEDRLRRIFHAYRVDPKTKDQIILPLPGDLTLPAAAVIGQPGTDHQYPGGYVKAGGRVAAEEKERRRAERAKRQGLA